MIAAVAATVVMAAEATATLTDLRADSAAILGVEGAWRHVDRDLHLPQADLAVPVLVGHHLSVCAATRCGNRLRRRGWRALLSALTAEPGSGNA
jgi:hypothetical protein